MTSDAVGFEIYHDMRTGRDCIRPATAPKPTSDPQATMHGTTRNAARSTAPEATPRHATAKVRAWLDEWAGPEAQWSAGGDSTLALTQDPDMSPLANSRDAPAGGAHSSSPGGSRHGHGHTGVTGRFLPGSTHRPTGRARSTAVMMATPAMTAQNHPLGMSIRPASALRKTPRLRPRPQPPIVYRTTTATNQGISDGFPDTPDSPGMEQPQPPRPISGRTSTSPPPGVSWGATINRREADKHAPPMLAVLFRYFATVQGSPILPAATATASAMAKATLKSTRASLMLRPPTGGASAPVRSLSSRPLTPDVSIDGSSNAENRQKKEESDGLGEARVGGPRSHIVGLAAMVEDGPGPGQGAGKTNVTCTRSHRALWVAEGPSRTYWTLVLPGLNYGDYPLITPTGMLDCCSFLGLVPRNTRHRAVLAAFDAALETIKDQGPHCGCLRAGELFVRTQCGPVLDYPGFLDCLARCLIAFQLSKEDYLRALAPPNIDQSLGAPAARHESRRSGSRPTSASGSVASTRTTSVAGSATTATKEVKQVMAEASELARETLAKANAVTVNGGNANQKETAIRTKKGGSAKIPSTKGRAQGPHAISSGQDLDDIEVSYRPIEAPRWGTDGSVVVPGMRHDNTFLVWEGGKWTDQGRDLENRYIPAKKGYILDPSNRIGGPAEKMEKVVPSPVWLGRENWNQAMVRATAAAMALTGMLHETPEDLYHSLGDWRLNEPGYFTHLHGRPLWWTPEDDRDREQRATVRAARPSSGSCKMRRVPAGSTASVAWAPHHPTSPPKDVMKVLFKVA